MLIFLAYMLIGIGITSYCLYFDKSSKNKSARDAIQKELTGCNFLFKALSISTLSLFAPLMATSYLIKKVVKGN